MKSIILLAAALFLISAPAPDSQDIAQITSNFIVPEDTPGLLAADELIPRNHVVRNDADRDIKLDNTDSAYSSGSPKADLTDF